MHTTLKMQPLSLVDLQMGRLRTLLSFKEELIRYMMGNIRTSPEFLKRRHSYWSVTANEELRLSNAGVHLPEKEGHQHTLCLQRENKTLDGSEQRP